MTSNVFDSDKHSIIVRFRPNVYLLTTAADAIPVRLVLAVGTMLRRRQAEERMRSGYWSRGVRTVTPLLFASQLAST